MRSPYVDPNVAFGDQLGFSLKKTIKKAQKTVSKTAKTVVGSKVVSEVERGATRALETGSPTSGIPIIVNPLGVVYGASQGDPTSLLALAAGGAAVGLPAGSLESAAGLVGMGLDIAGITGGPGGPDPNALLLPSDLLETPVTRIGWKKKVAIGLAVGAAAWFLWKKFKR